MGTKLRREKIGRLVVFAEVLVCVAIAAVHMNVCSQMVERTESISPVDGLEAASDKLSGEEYAILQSCVNDVIVTSRMSEHSGNGPDSLTIFPYTIQWPHDAQEVLISGTAMRSRDRDSLSGSFLKNNRRSFLLDGSKLQTTVGRGVPNPDQIRRMLRHGNGAVDRRAFDLVFPKAHVILRVSRPGINENGDNAILYVAHVDASRPGAGWLGMFLLEKRESQWYVARMIDGLQE